MKRIILSENSERFMFSKAASDDKFYGVLSSKGSRGFIFREEYRGGRYRNICVDELSRGNSWSSMYAESLKEAIDKFINFVGDIHFAVFEFDSQKELFLWLAK